MLPTGSWMGKRGLGGLRSLTQPAACDCLPRLPRGPVADGETEIEFSQVPPALLYIPGAISPQVPWNGVRPPPPALCDSWSRVPCYPYCTGCPSLAEGLSHREEIAEPVSQVGDQSHRPWFQFANSICLQLPAAAGLLGRRLRLVVS